MFNQSAADPLGSRSSMAHVDKTLQVWRAMLLQQCNTCMHDSLCIMLLIQYRMRNAINSLINTETCCGHACKWVQGLLR